MKYIPAWLPGASFKRKALEWRQMNQSMLNLPFDMVKQRMVSSPQSEASRRWLRWSSQAVGTVVPCFVANELERLFTSGGDMEEEKLIKDVAATVYAGKAIYNVSYLDTHASLSQPVQIR